MGGLYSKDMSEDTLKWNNVKTDNMSANKIISKLSSDAIKLIGLLDLSDMTDTESATRVKYVIDQANKTLSEEDRKQFKNLFSEAVLSDTMTSLSEPVDKSNETNQKYLSETSPFISSEMYENMLGNNKLVGGAKFDDDDSSTSSTTDNSEFKSLDDDDMPSSSSSDILSEPVKPKKDKKDNKKKSSQSAGSSEKTTEAQSTSSSDKATTESQSAGSLDYLSSSAHTDGDFSNSENSETLYKKKYDSTQNSVEDENSHLEASHSVNTSEINFI